MTPTPEDRRATDNDAKDQEEQQELFDAHDQMDEQDDAANPAEKETVEGNTDEELAADEKIRQREELLEETASI
jgi:hypothetical protein